MTSLGARTVLWGKIDYSFLWMRKLTVNEINPFMITQPLRQQRWVKLRSIFLAWKLCPFSGSLHPHVLLLSAMPTEETPVLQLSHCRGFSWRVWDAGEAELEFSGAEPAIRSTTRFKFAGEAAGKEEYKTWFMNKFKSWGDMGHPWDGDLWSCLDGDRRDVSTEHLPSCVIRRLKKFPPDLGSA